LVTAHLAAHEGPTHYASRCSNITNIFDQTKSDKQDELHDCTINSHHTFVFGDLNFRIKLPNKEDVDHEQHVKDVFQLIRKRDWKKLNENDELLKAVKAGHCMFGFKTLPCHFPPTFKVKREEGFTYNTQRTPSYTDRILWKSSHGLKMDILPLLYEPCPSFNASDHKAIRGAFSIIPRDKDTPKPASNREKLMKYLEKSARHLFSTRETRSHIDNLNPNASVNLNTDSCNMDIFISDISCTFFENVQSPTLTNHQMVTHVLCNTYPLNLMDEEMKGGSNKMNSLPKTSDCKGSFSLSWEGDELHVRLNVKSVTSLVGSFLYISLVKKKTGTKNSIIGTVALDLQLLCSQQNYKLKDVLGDGNMTTLELKSSPLLKNGILQGYLNCEVMVWRNKKITPMTIFSKRHETKKDGLKIKNKLFFFGTLSKPNHMFPPSKQEPKAKE